VLFNTFIGCIILLITNISLLYTSHLLARRFLPNTPASVRLVAICTLFYAFIILIFQALSPFHAITKTWVTITCLLLALGSHLIWGKQRNLQADIEPIKLWLRDGLNSRWACLLIICGFVVLLSLSRALLMPPLAWDCLTYHLTFAALWIKKGTLIFFNAPDQMSYNGFFPINGEIFASWLLLPFHNDLLVNTMNFPIMLLGGISCYAIARELGLTRKEASFAPALICFAPVVYTQITTEYVDIATFTFCCAPVLFTLRYLRKGHISDFLLAFVGAGILLGTKYNGIPVVGLIFIATTIKTISFNRHSGSLKKLSLILLGLLILCTLGGRQYILNSVEARNPLYPFSLEIFHHKIFEGSYYLEHVQEWVTEYEKNHELEKFNLWEKEYRKFCYKSLTAGPKFLLFLILALISLFSKPRDVTRKCWYLLSIIWIIPIVLFYTNNSTDFARRAYWSDASFRFLFPFIALFTIQGLCVIKKVRKHFREVDYFLVAFVGWDLLYINKTHLLEVKVLYPFMAFMIPLVIIVFTLLVVKLKRSNSKGATSFISSRLSRVIALITRRWPVYALAFIFLVGVLYFLQSYRDHTRYTYYRGHLDLHDFSRTFVNGWEFLDQQNGKKTIALTMDWEAPGHNWFFYPLLGRWLQNDIAYVSAKHKWEVPTWLHRGKLRGNEYSIWLHNLKRKKVDYILVQKPWPIELKWIQRYEDKFQLVFSDKYCKIFKYTGE